jgi:hypothetical protein
VADADVDVSSCPPIANTRAMTYRGNAAEGFIPVQAATSGEGHARVVLAPYSITVLDWVLATPHDVDP